MRYFYTILDRVVDGVTEPIHTESFQQASAARAQGKYVSVSVGGYSSNGKKF